LSDIVKDPNLAVAPDFTTDNFTEERKVFIDAGLTALQAAHALRNHWVVRNNCDKAMWQQQQQDAEAAQVADQERAHQLRLQQEEEEAQILRDEHKKNKAKFAPVPDRPVSSCPLILPSLVTTCKLKSHQFCELWYFTNAGLDEA
ncbi:hypothetical protein L210DRAFT_3343478, partial [Boletus edulis BED1]